MRLPTIFISTAFLLVSMSAALPVEREKMLAARSADSDFLAEVETRSYEEESELYARGCVFSKSSSDQNVRDNRHTSYQPLSSAGTSIIGLPPLSRMASRQSDSSGATLGSSPYRPTLSRAGSNFSGTTSASSHTPHHRRSSNEPSGINCRSEQRRAKQGLKFYNR